MVPRERDASLPRALNGKWTIDVLLGVGGMSSVYAGTHRNGMRAAIKILRKDLASDPAVRERFLREGRIANAVPHPGRITVLDDDVSDDGDPFLVMELLEGAPLADAIDREVRLATARVLQVFEVVLELLVGCHAVGIIHRDIKPDNVFLTRAGQVKLLDFGVARMRETRSRATRDGTALGTPSYMAPEQARGEHGAIDGRADLFSVGACMWHALTGTRLHAASSQVEALISARTNPAPSLARMVPSAPLALVALVDRALAFDRNHRFPDAASMLGDLRLVQETLAARAGRGTDAESPGSPTAARPDRTSAANATDPTMSSEPGATAGPSLAPAVTVVTSTPDAPPGRRGKTQGYGVSPFYEPGTRPGAPTMAVSSARNTVPTVHAQPAEADAAPAPAAPAPAAPAAAAPAAATMAPPAPRAGARAPSDDDGTYRFVADPSARRKKKAAAERPPATSPDGPPVQPTPIVDAARPRKPETLDWTPGRADKPKT